MLRQAIVCHLYYKEHIEKALELLEESEALADIFITCDDDLTPYVRRTANKYGISVRIRLYENKGMDILPFLKLLPELEASYDVVTKFHIKKEDNDVDSIWNKHGAEKLISPSVLEHINSVFTQNENVCFAGIAPFYLSCKKLMLHNGEYFNNLLHQINGLNSKWESFGFFAGTSFSVRPHVLKNFSEWAKKNEKAFEENYSADGNLVNALERMFVLSCNDNDQIALIFTREKTLFSQICKPYDFVSQASTRELASMMKFIGEDIRDLSALIEHKKRTFGSQEFFGKTSYPLYYLFFEQFLFNTMQLEAFRVLRYQRATIDWQLLAAQKRKKSKVSIIIPVYNQPDLTEKCISSIYNNPCPEILEVIAVDNGSEPSTKRVLKQLEARFDSLSIITLDKNMNFSFGCNIGFAKSRGEFVVFLNNDIEVSQDWLSTLVEPLKSKQYFATQPLLIYPDNTIQSVGISFSSFSCVGYGIYNGISKSFAENIVGTSFSAVTAACMCVAARNFAAVDGFSTVYVNGQEDIDLCFKLKQQTSLMAKVVTKSVLLHHESKSEGRFDNVKANRHIFIKRWASCIEQDDLERFKHDKVLVTSLTSDDRNIPFWIKSSFPKTEPIKDRSAISLISALYQSNENLLNILSSLFFLTNQSPALAPAFEYTLNDLREKVSKVSHITRTVIIAQNAFSVSHNFANYLYDYYKLNRSSVGIALISRRERLSQSSYENMTEEPRQTDCLYLDEGRIQLNTAIQFAISHKADNLHLIDLSTESLVLAAVYKYLFNSNVYLESLSSLPRVEPSSKALSESLPFIDILEPVITGGFNRYLIDEMVNGGVEKAPKIFSFVFFYDEKTFVEVLWFSDYLRRFFQAKIDIKLILQGEMSACHEAISSSIAIFQTSTDQGDQSTIIYGDTLIFFTPFDNSLSSTHTSSVIYISESVYSLSLIDGLENYTRFSRPMCEIVGWLNEKSRSNKTMIVQEKRIDQLRDRKRGYCEPLDVKRSRQLLTGDLESFLKNS